MTDQITRLGISVDTKNARPAVRGLRTDLDRLTTSGEKASAQSAILTRTLAVAGTTLAAYAGSQSVGKLVADASRLESINSRIGNLTGDLASSQKFLTESAAELSAEYTTLADGYSRLLPLYKAGVLSLTEAQTITKGLAEVQAATGASSADLGRSIFGLAQGLSAGTLRAEELNQVTEALPGLLQELDVAAGLAGGGFRKLVIDGKVTSDFFKDTLQVALESYAGTAASLSGNITQSFNRAKNEYTELVGAFAQPINTVATGSAQALADSLEFINDNSDEVVIGFQAIGAAAALAFGGASLNAVANFGKTQADSLKQAIDRQDEFTKKLATRADRQAVYRAKSTKSAADEALAEATLTKEVAKANAVRVASAVQAKEKLVSSAQLAVLKKQEILSEGQLLVALSKTTQAEALRAVARAEQGAISATTNAVRLKYAQSLEAASVAEARASVAVAAAANEEALAKTNLNKASAISDAQSRRLAQARINEGKASAAVVASATAEGAAYGSANKAKIASIAATQNLAKANTAADAAIRRATVAQRLQTVSAIASRTATTAAAGAMSLIGGPTGAALLAVGGIAYLSLKQTEAEKSAESLTEAVDALSDTYFKNEQAARNAGEAQLEAAENTLEAFRAQISAVQSEITLNAFSDFFNAREIDQARESMREVYDEIDRINTLIEKQASLAASVSPYDNQALADSAEAFDLVGARAQAAGNVLEKLIPDDAKRQRLEDYGTSLEEALQVNAISQEEYDRGTQAINSQLAALNGVANAAKQAEDAAKKLQSIVSEALPQRTAFDEQAEKLAILDAAYAKGDENAHIYADAITALSETFRAENLEAAADKIKDITNALSERADTPFQKYQDEIELLNRAIAEVPDQAGDLAGKLQTAFANLDFEIRGELTVAQGDTAAELQGSFNEQSAALEQFHAERNVSEAQAQADRVKLAESFGDQLVDANRSALDKLSGLGGLTQAIQLDFEISGDQISLARLLRDGEITKRQFEEAERLQAISHQEQLSEIVRSGLGTREQYEEASALDKISSNLNRFDAEITAATTVGNAVLSHEAERQEIRSAAADAQLTDDQARYDEALKAFEDNASDENKAALTKATKDLAISEAAAKNQFERSKKFAIAQAVVAQGLTVAQAFADPKLDALQKFAVAASSALAVASAIRGIKSGSFSGSSTSISSSSDTSVSANTSSGDSSEAGQNIQIINLNGVLATDTDSVIAQSVKRLADDGYILDSSLNTLNTQNITVQ